MAYPYTHKNRAQGADVIELHKLGTDEGTPVTFTAALTTGGVAANANLPYNSWELGFAFWSTGNDRALSIKVYPWVDHAQTILGPALFLAVPGNTAAASVVTLAATGAATTRGSVFYVLAGAYAASANAAQKESIPVIHGLKVNVTAVTALTRGTYDWEMVAVPRA